jgi:rhodanese-related sulfurtransferase
VSDHSGDVGEMPAAAAYELLCADPAAVLIDVRTAAEWSFVGVPDLSGIGKQAIFSEWQSYPLSQPVAGFADSLRAQLAAKATPLDAPLLFLCRSGARSLAAARAMAALGYSRCVNVAGGFEGPCDASRQRGRRDGWKARELPWVQS